MRCRNCQGELPVSAAFCPTCGTLTADSPPNQGTGVSPTPAQPIFTEPANPYMPSPATNYGTIAPPPPPFINPYSPTDPHRVQQSMPYSTPSTFYPYPVPPPASNHRRLLIVLLVLCLLLVLGGGGTWFYLTHQNPHQPLAHAGTSTATSCVAGSLQISGSTALYPLVAMVAKDYQKQCSSATITVQKGGSSLGKQQLEAGQVGIGDSDAPASADQTDLIDHQVAVVIFSVIVNFHADVTSLTSGQIQGIYDGKSTNWKQVGGANLPIVVVSRPPGSGTRATFEQHVLGWQEAFSGPDRLKSDDTGTIVNEVSQTPGAIGYAATGQVPTGSGANVIAIDGNLANTTNVESDTYKFWNIEHMYTKGQPTPIEQALLDYMDSPQGVYEQTMLGFVPLTQMQSTAIAAHNSVPQP